MPASWKDTELLAACLAYLEASENGGKDAATLESLACDAYGKQLEHVNSEVKHFEESTHKHPLRQHLT